MGRSFTKQLDPACVGYMRYSSKIQAKGNSEERQESGYEAFLESSGLRPWHEIYWNKGDMRCHVKSDNRIADLSIDFFRSLERQFG